jgi:hypothetical protein
MSTLNSQIPNHAAAVTASATTEQFGHALYCGGDGTVTLVTEGGETATFTVRAGTTLIIRFTKVTAATATGLMRLWGT